jgi:hypothetical protein
MGKGKNGKACWKGRDKMELLMSPEVPLLWKVGRKTVSSIWIL